MVGKLVSAEWGEPYGFVHYEGDRFAVATDLQKLEWADEQLL